MRLLGMDEAGRGCVLGPLVVGAFLLEGDDQGVLKAAGATDSKVLSAKKRAEVRARLVDLGVSDLERVSARQIDAANINDLELEAFAQLIARHRPDRVLMDAPCHPRAIPNFLAKLFRRVAELGVAAPEIVAEPKADLTYPVVGAASIFAKLDRDAAIAGLGPVGSGYPSDPKTRQWLAGFIARGEPFPACVRTRWGTIRKLQQSALLP